MGDPVFGISITRVNNEPRPAVVGDMSVVGLVGTAPAANPETFPLNIPVLIFSDDAAALTALGDSGTLPDAIAGVSAQLGEFQVAAKIVVVRIDPGANDTTAMTAIIGSQAAKTGIWALPEAGPVLGVVPRLIGVPGYTHQQESGLASLVLGTQGTNMTAAPTVTFTGGGSDPGKVMPTATATLGTGADAGKVVSLTITSPGSNLSGAISVGFSGGGSDAGKVFPTATGTIDVLANPVVAALPPVLSRLLAVAVVDGGTTSLTGFQNFRETISSERIIPLASTVRVGPTAIERSAVGRILGLAVRRDHEGNGVPGYSWANQPVQGIVGVNRPIGFSLTDDATEGQQILAVNGGVILRGEAGVETAIAASGFIYVGTDTCSADSLWQFYNVVRLRDYIHLAYLKTLRYYLGRFNITRQTIESIRSTMLFFLRDLAADEWIIDGKVFFTRDQNTPENLRAGKFTIDFAAEEAPVLRHIAIRSNRYRVALDLLLDDLLAGADLGV